VTITCCSLSSPSIPVPFVPNLPKFVTEEPKRENQLRRGALTHRRRVFRQGCGDHIKEHPHQWRAWISVLPHLMRIILSDEPEDERALEVLTIISHNKKSDGNTFTL
jgi:hypothetical protein